MALNILELIAGTSVDLKGLEEGLNKAEAMAEESAKKIAASWSIVGVGIATAIAGTVVVALEKAIKTTAEWGLEMEHMASRMGVTAKEAATLVGVMERFGVNANTGARAMQMLSSEIRQTQNSLDPFATRLGQTLGSLRNTNGEAMNMAQVLDLVRQKVAGASSDTERLQIATSLLGARIGGQLVPMLKLSNEEWEKQKAAVQASLGPVDQAAEQALAYKQATAGLEQAFRGLQVTIGTALLPMITDLANTFAMLFTTIKNNWGAISSFFKDALGPLADLNSGMKSLVYTWLWWGEVAGTVAKGTAANFLTMDEQVTKSAAEIGRANEEAEQSMAGLGNEVKLTEQNMRKIVDTARQQMTLLEKAHSLGMAEGNIAAERVQLEQALNRLTEQRVQLEKQLGQGTTEAQRERIEKDILKNRVEAAQLTSDFATKTYKDEELHIKAAGQMTLENEIELLQKKLADEKIVGDERLKVEAELVQKRKQYAQEEELRLKAQGAWNLENEVSFLQKRLADENLIGADRLKIEGDLAQKRRQLAEEVVKQARALGMASVDQEIAYRKQKAAELAGKGDITGAAQELVKVRDLVLKQADEIMEFTKKLRVVSLQDEMDYQRKKLALFKGNAEEEMKILGQIADLDKQLYDKRLQFTVNYTQNAIQAYRDLMKATHQEADAVAGATEEQSFQRAAVDAERARIQQARQLEYIAAHGGTEEQRNLALKQAQDIMKQYEEMVRLGKEVSDGMKADVEAAKDVLKAGGVEDVRVPGEEGPEGAEARQLGLKQLTDAQQQISKEAADSTKGAAGEVRDALAKGGAAAFDAMKEGAHLIESGSMTAAESIKQAAFTFRDTVESVGGKAEPTSDLLRELPKEMMAEMRGVVRAAQPQERPADGDALRRSIISELEPQFKELSASMKEIVSAAGDIFRAASSGQEARPPGGPSPVVGSLLGPAEGLATSSLARGTDIPRLDTSFTDIAIRIRDVLLGVIPNIQNFSNQLAAATRQMSTLTNLQNNPGIVGPGGSYTLGGTYLGSPAPSTASSTPAPTQGPGAQAPAAPTSQVGIGSQTAQTNQKLDNLTQAVKDLPAAIVAGAQSQQAANTQSLAAALASVVQQRDSNVNVSVSLDPGTGDLLINRIVQEIS